MRAAVPVVCSVGATEPWNAAGLGLDIRAIGELGGRPVTVVAAVTAQDAAGLRSHLAVPPELIAAQFDALTAAGIGAYRIGALVGAAGVRAVALELERRRLPAVYDPVVAASAGGTFADAETLAAIRAVLLPRVSVVTPNAHEAALLTGVAVRDAASAGEAALALRRLGAAAAIVTGGHLAGDAVDVLADASGVTAFAAPRLPLELRGTGCLLAAALATALARGESAREALPVARAFVRAKIEAGATVAGMRLAY